MGVSYGVLGSCLHSWHTAFCFHQHPLVRLKEGLAIKEDQEMLHGTADRLFEADCFFLFAHYAQWIDPLRILFSSTLQATELSEGNKDLVR